MDFIIIKAKTKQLKSGIENISNMYIYICICIIYDMYVIYYISNIYRKNVSWLKKTSKSSSYRGLILSQKIIVWGYVQTKKLEQCKNSSLHKSCTSPFKSILVFFHWSHFESSLWPMKRQDSLEILYYTLSVFKCHIISAYSN